jgi:hypothetical protein
MIQRRTMTVVALLAIPVALFSEMRMEGGFVRYITNLTAAVLIFFGWDAIAKQQLSRSDMLLWQTYLVGLFVFGLWLGLNSIVVSTYESSWHSSRDAAFRNGCLRIEPPLVFFGAALAALFMILGTARIIITIRNRRTRSLKASNV